MNVDLTPRLNGQALSSEAAPAQTVLLYEWVGNQTDVTNVAENTSPNGWGMDSGGDGFHHGNGSYATGDLGQPANTNSNNNDDGGQHTGRHTDGSNFLFSDGHVKWLRPSAVSPGINQDSANIGQDLGSRTGYSAAGTGVSSFAGTFSEI